MKKTKIRICTSCSSVADGKKEELLYPVEAGRIIRLNDRRQDKPILGLLSLPLVREMLRVSLIS